MANVENINNEQTEREYVHCTIPKWAAGRESAHRYTTKEGQPRMSLTLPPHTNVTLPNGETLDASFYKLDVPAKAVHEYENDAKNYSVGFPVATKDGEPWEVTLTKQNGCWEHPEAEGEERGAYKVFSTESVHLDSTSFTQDMQVAREERRAFAQEQAKDKAPEKSPSLKQAGKQARAASDAQKGEKAPAKAKSAPEK